MSLTQLQYFVAVAEEGNVGRAARRLHISQPPLSRQIKSLESELGTNLFSRGARGMTLSPQGRRLLEHARRILADVQRTREEFVSPSVGRENGDQQYSANLPSKR